MKMEIVPRTHVDDEKVLKRLLAYQEQLKPGATQEV